MKLFGFDITRATPAAARIEPPVTGAVTAAQSDQAGLRNFSVGWTSITGASRVKGIPRVTPERAEGHGTVFSCCNNIAGDLAKVPLKLYQRRPGGLEERIRDHPASYLLNVEASPGVPAQIMRFAMVYAYTLRGNGYAYGPRDGGGELERIELIRRGRANMLESGAARFYQFEDMAGTVRRVPSRSMLHLRYMADDGWTGRSPLQVAAESVGIALAGQHAAARTAAGGTTKAVIKMADDYENDEARTRNARRVKEQISDPDADGYPVMGPGEDIKSLDLSAADQELLSSRKFDREQIAAIYRMPPSKLQMLEFGVKANGEQQAIDYLTDCLMHWSRLVEAQMALAVLTETERRAGYFLRHDFGALLQPTVKEETEALVKAVGGPFRTPNEARRIKGLAPLPDGGKLNPAPNMTRKDGGDDASGDPDKEDDE